LNPQYAAMMPSAEILGQTYKVAGCYICDLSLKAKHKSLRSSVGSNNKEEPELSYEDDLATLNNNFREVFEGKTHANFTIRFLEDQRKIKKLLEDH
jgi:hypothetical protein